MYDQLDDEIRRYVDALIDHAQSALWPERRAALDSFRRGIAGSDPKDVKAALTAVPFELPPYFDANEALFRLVLTAYLVRLGPSEVNNPDQAEIYASSLDDGHRQLAQRWFDAH